MTKKKGRVVKLKAGDWYKMSFEFYLTHDAEFGEEALQRAVGKVLLSKPEAHLYVHNAYLTRETMNE